MKIHRAKTNSGSASRKHAVKQPATPPSHDQIAELARKYWAERGCPEGSPEQDWIRAEKDLMGKAS